MSNEQKRVTYHANLLIQVCKRFSIVVFSPGLRIVVLVFLFFDFRRFFSANMPC